MCWRGRDDGLNRVNARETLMLEAMEDKYRLIEKKEGTSSSIDSHMPHSSFWEESFFYVRSFDRLGV